MTKYGTSPWIDRFPKSRVPSLSAASRHRSRPTWSIVGGGLTGCATAYAMAAAGVKVVLLEAEQIGRGGTGSGSGLDRRRSRRELCRAREGARPAAGAPRVAGLAPRGPRLRGAAPAAEDPVRAAGSRRRRRTTAEQTLRLKREQKARRDAGLDAPLLNARVVGAEAGLAAAGIRARDGATIDPYRAAPRAGARRVRARRAGVRALAGGADHVRPPDGRHPHRGRHDPRQPRRRRDRRADAALQGAAPPLLVSTPLRGAHRAGSGQDPPAARPARRGRARLGRAAAHRAVGGRRAAAGDRRRRRRCRRIASARRPSFSGRVS